MMVWLTIFTDPPRPLHALAESYQSQAGSRKAKEKGKRDIRDSQGP